MAGSSKSLGNLYARVMLLTVFVCAMFTCVASFGLAIRMALAGFEEAPGFMARLLVKGALAWVALLGAGWGTARHGLARPIDQGNVAPQAERVRLAPIGFVIALALALLVPNLTGHPGAAPDELHHLIVARNLAVHGDYASEHPHTRFTRFDPYDSVGPTVIAPVAGTMRLFGDSLWAARSAMATFGVLLLCAMYWFVCARSGWPSALCACLAALGAYGTVYFSRSLYGEAPALMFFLIGLILWGRSISLSRLRWAMAAGVFFGLAAVTKTFMLVSVAAFAGAWFYDRTYSRQIAFRNVLATGAGSLAPILLWAAVRAAYSQGDAPDGSSVLYYRHYLMFGLGALDTVFALAASHPIALLVSAGAWLAAAPTVFTRRDPALWVAFLVAPLFAFWWVFFTPAQIPRYLWYSSTITAGAGGALVPILLRRDGGNSRRLACAFAAGIIIAMYGAGIAWRAVRIYTVDLTRSERQLAEYLRALPADQTVYTTSWVAERVANFFADSAITMVQDPSEAKGPLICDADDETVSAADISRDFGRYVIVGEEIHR